ncbi:hypothetical protein GCM10017559_30850 [Streptosporangium longisporum]|uniref:Uncharacterized protein n=1 Tax=Streptosporangium longisporum TaxID=46187 RepID=A0ABP6KK27_9ACTN
MFTRANPHRSGTAARAPVAMAVSPVMSIASTQRIVKVTFRNRGMPFSIRGGLDAVGVGGWAAGRQRTF